MPILNIVTSQTGTVGVLPSISYINTSDTIAEVTTSGYLNNSVQSSLASFSLPCMCLVSTVASAGVQPIPGWYALSFSAGNWLLTAV